MDEPQVPLATFYAYDQDDIDKYAHASNYSLILWDIETKLRNDYKWGDFSNHDSHRVHRKAPRPDRGVEIRISSAGVRRPRTESAL